MASLTQKFFKKQNKTKGILTLLASLCFLIHFFPVPDINLVPFSSESTLLCPACDTRVHSKHLSLGTWQMLFFVSRGHWEATAGERAPILVSVCFFSSCSCGVWDTQGCPPSREFTSTHWVASQ